MSVGSASWSYSEIDTNNRRVWCSPSEQDSRKDDSARHEKNRNSQVTPNDPKDRNVRTKNSLESSTTSSNHSSHSASKDAGKKTCSRYDVSKADKSKSYDSSGFANTTASKHEKCCKVEHSKSRDEPAEESTSRSTEDSDADEAATIRSHEIAHRENRKSRC